MLIAPRISNRVGEQIAHTTIEDFKALKSKATSDEPTEKNDSSENSISNSNLAADPARSENDPLWQIEDEEGNNENGELPDSVINVDFDRLYSDSIVYNENLKKHQHELLTNEQSYQSPALNLSSYGITIGSVTTLSTVNTTLTAINLPLGSYYLVETTAPSGKMANGKKIPFTIAPDSTQTLNLTISVKDNNIIIPNTGSNGRVVICAVGVFSFIAALAVFAYYRKKKN